MIMFKRYLVFSYNIYAHDIGGFRSYVGDFETLRECIKSLKFQWRTNIFDRVLKLTDGIDRYEIVDTHTKRIKRANLDAWLTGVELVKFWSPWQELSI